MKVYLIDKKTNKVLREFDDAVEFADNYVIFSQSGNLGKLYAESDKFFTDKRITDKEQKSEDPAIEVNI